jgi:ATP-binding cassette, subfamily B, multidrug efflux pump
MLGVGVFGLLGGAGLNLLGPWIIAQAIDVDLANSDAEGLTRSAALFAVVLVANLVVVYISRLALEVSAQRAMLSLKMQLFDHLVDHDLAFHDEQSSGRLITRVQGDTEALRVLFTQVILAFPADALLFIGMFGVLWFTEPVIASIVFGVLPPYVLLFLIFRRVSPQRFLALRKVRAQLTGFLAEHLRAMPTLRQFGRHLWADSRAEALDREVLALDISANLQPVWYFNSVVLVRIIGIVALLWVGAGMVSNGLLTVGVLIMGLGYLRQMFHPLMRLSHQLTTIERARAAGSRIAEILDAPRTIVDPQHPTEWPGLNQGLRMEDVRFHYTEGTPVLKGLSLHVPAGQHIGIVGATGSGKSTVLNLLLRFRDPISGRVSVDGVDLRELRIQDLRDHIGLVLQDVHLFAGTVLENLGGDADAVTSALQTVGLPMGLETVLTDAGENLSRGERQLLTFARALVTDPTLLVLDEATSAVDPATEARVQAALARLMQGRTTVTVAHRLVTVRDCDRIVVLAHGRVAEQGSHDELIRQGGLYAGLHALQAVA